MGIFCGTYPKSYGIILYISQVLWDNLVHILSLMGISCGTYPKSYGNFLWYISKVLWDDLVHTLKSYCRLLPFKLEWLKLQWLYVPVWSQEPVVHWLSLFACLLLFVLCFLNRLGWSVIFHECRHIYFFGAFYSLLCGMDPCSLLKAVEVSNFVCFL